MSISDVGSVPDAIARHAADAGDSPALTYLHDGESVSVSMTYTELDRRAAACAELLCQDAEPGDRIVISFPETVDFVVAFLGCLYAGLVAVPVYPPRRGGRHGTRLLSAAVEDSQPRIVWTSDASAFGVVDPDGEPTPRSWRPSAQDGPGWRLPAPDPAALAFLQYTSGSTSSPKGVMVSHGNLLHCERMIATAFEHSAASTFGGWLPVYHDMGLIAQILQPLTLGAHSVSMPPEAFLQRPARWLRMINRFGVRTSGGPNFAYDLCTQRIPDEDLLDLDLSGWEIAFNGSEPVRASTLAAFERRFARVGFRSAAAYPCYGLAEITLFATGPTKGSGYQTVDGSALVGCGHAWLDRTVRIVDPATLREAQGDEVGEIWLAGADVAGGYWRRPELSEQTFGARLAGDPRRFLRTGDLGRLTGEGELVVTGRLKDVIVLEGRNLYPQDVELSVDLSASAVRTGCAVAYEFADGDGRARLGIVAEVRQVDDGTDYRSVIGSIRRRVSSEHLVRADRVTLIAPGSIPKTTSGKLQRNATRAAVRDGALPVLACWPGSSDA